MTNYAKEHNLKELQLRYQILYTFFDYPMRGEWGVETNIFDFDTSTLAFQLCSNIERMTKTRAEELAYKNSGIRRDLQKIVQNLHDFHPMLDPNLQERFLLLEEQFNERDTIRFKSQDTGL